MQTSKCMNQVLSIHKGNIHHHSQKELEGLLCDIVCQHDHPTNLDAKLSCSKKLCYSGGMMKKQASSYVGSTTTSILRSMMWTMVTTTTMTKNKMKRSSSHQQDKKERRKKKLTFHDQPDVRRISSRKDLSPQEQRDMIWYSREEYETITQACLKEIMMLDRGELLRDTIKYCARGLETHTTIQSRIKKMNRTLAYKSVLQEQQRQREQGILNAIALARVYHDASSSCQLWAQAVGLADQKEAQEIGYESDDDRIMVSWKKGNVCLSSRTLSLS